MNSAYLLAWIVIVPVAGWGGYLVYTRLARATERAAVAKRIEPRF